MPAHSLTLLVPDDVYPEIPAAVIRKPGNAAAIMTSTARWQCSSGPWTRTLSVVSIGLGRSFSIRLTVPRRESLACGGSGGRYVR